MRVLLQRVAHASVAVQGLEIGKIGNGLLLFVGVAKGDTEEDARYLSEKILNLRIFADSAERFNCSALDTKAELLIVSQFTLYGNTRRGRRPDFTEAASPQDAQLLYERFVDMLRASGLRIETGRFGEYMQVDLQNDGPVTLLLDSADRSRPKRIKRSSSPDPDRSP